MTLPLDQPVLVERFAGGEQRFTEFLHGLEGPDPEQVLLERPDESLRRELNMTRLLCKPISHVSIQAIAAVLSLLTASTVAGAFEANVPDGARSAEGNRIFSPFVGRDYPDQVLFGDLHFHTEISFDAGLIGTNLDMHEAFRVARGEKIISNTGQPVQLIRPLDFLAITEHAEMLGLATAIRTADQRLLADEWGRQTYELFHSGQEGRVAALADIVRIATVEGRDPLEGTDLDSDIWLDIIETVDQYNDPGVFTSLAGFEWTFTPQGDNLHRVVIFGDGAEYTRQTRPFSFFEGPDPELLWDYLASYEDDTGGEVIAVPHNGNISNGLMFAPTKFDGSPMDADYAAKRIRWEPMHEMTQIKGDEETHPLLSPDDEFADFETWDVGNISGSAPKTPEMLRYEYARSALKVGLEVERELGVNPFKFGFYGTTDTHTAIPTTREDNYFGKYQHTEPSAHRHDLEVIPAENEALRILTAQESAAGLTAVWARENTREEVFGAITRKEAYATTGTRIRVRTLGGWNFTEEDLGASDFVSEG